MLAVLAVLLGAWPYLAAAQDASPTLANNVPLDLAAIALAPDDVPEGFFEDSSEWLVPVEAFAALVLGDAPVPSGLERVYQSFYVDPENGDVLHNYLYEFASAEEAVAGFSVVDAALRPPLPEGSVVGPTHAPGPDLGDGDTVVTLVTYDTWAAGGPRADVVATSFRHDRLVAGVAVERYTDPPAGSTPVTDAATPFAPDPAQENLSNRLASIVDARIAALLAGETPPGVDRALADLVLPLDRLVGDGREVFGGYKAGIDLLRCGVCREENALVPFANEALSGFSRTVFVGAPVDGEAQPPFVSVAMTTFASPEAALGVLEEIRQAPDELPTPGPVPRGNRTLVADPEIPGTMAALAFQATLDAEDPGAPADSAGVDFVAGNRLVAVDVQGGLSGEEALAVAVDLATQQAACLTAGGACTSFAPPALLEGSTAA
jgi:hypothetical protein